MRLDQISTLRHTAGGILCRGFQWFEDYLDRHPGAREVGSQGSGFGDLANDTEIHADKALGRFFHDAFGELPEIGRIAVEGGTDVTYEGKCDACIYIDPLDGSLNFARSDAGLCLPYTVIVTVYGKRENLTYDDVVICGLLDLRNGDLLMAHKTEAGFRTDFTPAKIRIARPAKTRKVSKLDIGSDIAICEPYYPDREWIAEAFRGQKGWLRSPGSAAYEMGLVARGVAVVYACLHQKQHEGPGGRALVLGAGGYVCDFEGKNIGSRHVDFKSQDDIVLAANGAVAEAFLRLLRR